MREVWAVMSTPRPPSATCSREDLTYTYLTKPRLLLDRGRGTGSASNLHGGLIAVAQLLVSCTGKMTGGITLEGKQGPQITPLFYYK